jgi:uncharacterized GH25 family protein
MSASVHPRHMPKAKGALAVVLALVCAATLAGAHETWILPSTMRVATGHPVTLSLTSGMAFPADDFAIDPKRIARAEIRLNGNIEQLRGARARSTALRYAWTPRAPGVATIAVELAPKTLELPPNLIEEYFQEIHAGPTIRAQWDSIAEPKKWRESYIKHATSFVRVGAPKGRADSSWASPVGLGLEIVPERDPTALVEGDALAVRVLRGGAPLSGFAVGARREGQAGESFVTTDATGRVSVPLPQAGRWLLFGTDLRRAKEPALEWRSDFVTATIGVRAKR